MRFTVKAKLACAFGVIIILSGVAGTMAYTKLSEMIAGMTDLASRAGRIEKAGELQKELLLQNRAEKNLLSAENESEAERFAAEMMKFRPVVSKMRDEIYAVATEAGRQILDRFASDYAKVNSTQDETVKAYQNRQGEGDRAFDRRRAQGHG